MALGRRVSLAKATETTQEAEGAAEETLLAGLLEDAGPGNGAGRVRMLDPKRVAPNPLNPRGELDLDDDFIGSVKANGILQPATVMARARFVELNPTVALPPETDWVLLIGHRRHGVALLAGIQLPALIRNDLAGVDVGLVAMLVENIHRKPLDAMEEARAFQALLDAGLSQRDIATRTGRKPALVNTRLALLKLPQVVQDAVPVLDALPMKATLTSVQDLSRLPADAQESVWKHAVASGSDLAEEVVAYRRAAEFEEKVAELRDRAEKEGIAFILDAASRKGFMLVEDAEEIAEAREHGSLFLSPTPSGSAAYYDNAAGREADPAARVERNQDAKAREVERRNREEACKDLVSVRPSTVVVTDALVEQALYDRVRIGDGLKMVYGWLHKDVGPQAATTPYEWRDGLTERDRPWVAYALTLASLELYARRTAQNGWDDVAVRYVQMLIDKTAFQPSEWERAQINSRKLKVVK